MTDTSSCEGRSQLLERIKRPSDLKAFTADELTALADEMRERILATAAANGGHLAPHLGVVELAIAMHYVYDAERDALVWDVGHQCYAHKMLTGRGGELHTIRKRGGLSGYPKIAESPYDFFGVGHSSTSISAALGYAAAKAQNNEEGRAIAVIGDGAMTAGMAWEALAHAGHLGHDLLVVLNDNRMSISPNVGALSAYFNRLITGGLYTRAREDIAGFVKNILGPQLSQAAHRVEHSVKGLITPGTIFEELGFRYVGPVDGHDLHTLVECFNNLKHISGPVFFHVVTQKGKGYEYAEEDPLTYHGVKAFNIQTGEFEKSSAAPVETFTEAFAEALIDSARGDDRVVAITAAMPTGTGLSAFEKHFPTRSYDVGICEQHAVTFAGGLARAGMRPACAIYSTFLQRGYDQYVHDVCLQDLPVLFAIDRAGAVGEDSPTQQGAFDISFLRVIPNIQVLAPRDGADLRAMVAWGLKQDGPVAVRYARSKAPAIGPVEGRDIMRGEILREGSDAVVLGVGPCLANALAAAEQLESEGVSVAVADARWVKPLDGQLLDQLADRPILTMEENTVSGGFGSAVLEYFQQQGRLHEVRIQSIGFPDAFLEHATRDEQIEEIGLHPEGIAASVRKLVSGLETAESI